MLARALAPAGRQAALLQPRRGRAVLGRELKLTSGVLMLVGQTPPCCRQEWQRCALLAHPFSVAELHCQAGQGLVIHVGFPRDPLGSNLCSETSSCSISRDGQFSEQRHLCCSSPELIKFSSHKLLGSTSLPAEHRQESSPYASQSFAVHLDEELHSSARS